MKGIILFITLFFISITTVIAQYPKGSIITDSLYSKSLENNAGENPTRSIHIYLPPGYNKATTNYPVIYYLHGFSGSDKKQIEVLKFDKLLDKAIATGKIKPVIVVIPNHHTLYRGSFHTNSSLTGNWNHFTAKDLVNYIDENYRTIKKKKAEELQGFQWEVMGR